MDYQIFEFCIPSIKRLKLSKKVEVLSEVSLNELDLTLEASAADELAENFKNHHNYRVPKFTGNLQLKTCLFLNLSKGLELMI